MILFLVLLGLAALGGLAAWLFRDSIRARRIQPGPLPPCPSEPGGLGPLSLLRLLEQVLDQDPWLVEAWILENLEALDAGSVERVWRRLMQDPGRSPGLTERVLLRVARQGPGFAMEVAAFRVASRNSWQPPPI